MEIKRRISEAKRGKPSPLRGRALPPEHRAKIAASARGRKHSEETKKKLSEIAKKQERRTGYKPSEETRRKMSKAAKGRRHTAETRKKMSASHIGKKLSEETRRRMSEAAKKQPKRTGWKHSEATKKKISEKAKQRVYTQEFGRRVSARLKKRYETHPGTFTGRKHTEESKRKISEAKKGSAGTFTGRKHSEESKQKMSDAGTGRKHMLSTRARISRSLGGMGDWFRMETHRERYYQDTQSKRVRKRDNYTCEACGQRMRESDMHCHHIVPKAKWWRIEHYPDEWCATLCNSCHKVTGLQKGPIQFPVASDGSSQSKIPDFIPEDAE